MKLENVKVGMRVFVKTETDETQANTENCGKYATVSGKESCSYDGYLTVKVLTDDGETDWMRHKDVRKLRDGEV